MWNVIGEPLDNFLTPCITGREALDLALRSSPAGCISRLRHVFSCLEPLQQLSDAVLLCGNERTLSFSWTRRPRATLTCEHLRYTSWDQLQKLCSFRNRDWGATGLNLRVHGLAHLPQPDINPRFLVQAKRQDPTGPDYRSFKKTTWNSYWNRERWVERIKNQSRATG